VLLNCKPDFDVEVRFAQIESEFGARNIQK
jgi:hypothetical protein